MPDSCSNAQGFSHLLPALGIFRALLEDHDLGLHDDHGVGLGGRGHEHLVEGLGFPRFCFFFAICKKGAPVAGLPGKIY